MQDILLHPGFHRTGTSSMQHFLWRNHAVLAPHLELMMLRHLKPVVRQAAHIATTHNPLDLLEMTELLDAAFDARALPDGTNLLISCEGLCGHMPGRIAVDDYAAAPMLVQYIAGYLTERFPNARVRVIFSTRDADDWLRSVYRYQLRSTRLTLDEADFVAKYRPAADLDAVLSDIAASLAPIEVSFIPFDEAIAAPQGPGAALLRQCAIPEDIWGKLHSVGLGNAGPTDALCARFLELNRSTLPDHDVTAHKQTIAKEANLGTWKHL
jgi:hypothetical protein